MLPASCVIQPELTYVGEFGWGGGFAVVSKGEYRGLPVAIKHLRIGTKDGFDKVFKVSNCAPEHITDAYSSSSNFVGKFLSGSAYLIRMSYLCWEFLCQGTLNISASSLSGCPMEI